MRRMGKTFGERFREVREQRGLSQDDIASVCKNRSGDPADKASISSWENDKTYPTYENLLAAATRMDVSVDYLMGLSGTKVQSGESYGIHVKHLADCIEVLDDSLPETQYKMDPRKRAQLIARLYKETPIDGPLPSAKVLEIVRPIKLKHRGGSNG